MTVIATRIQVATMLAHGETRLLTFNTADFSRLAPLIQIVAP